MNVKWKILKTEKFLKTTFDCKSKTQEIVITSLKVNDMFPGQLKHESYGNSYTLSPSFLLILTFCK